MKREGAAGGLAADNFVINPDSDQVYHQVEQGKHQDAYPQAPEKQRGVVHAHGGQDLAQYWKGHSRMDDRHAKGQKEDHQHLLSNGRPYLPAAHSHLFHNPEPVVILKALGDLFIIDHQHSGNEKHQHKEQPHKEDAAVYSEEILPHVSFVLKGKPSVVSLVVAVPQLIKKRA